MASTRESIQGASAVPRKAVHGYVTPHKLSVLLIIRAYCYMKTKALLKGNRVVITTQNRKDFCLLALRLIQGPELTLPELCAVLTSGCYTFPAGTLECFARYLREMEEKAGTGILDLMQVLEALLTDPSHHNSPVINRSSVLGLHLRTMLLSFDKLSFSQVVQAAEAFQSYCHRVKLPWEKEESRPVLDNTEEVMDLNEKLTSMLDLREHDVSVDDTCAPGSTSRRQAELILAQQAKLLQDHECAAQSPPELQRTIHQLLEANPDLAEAHYLSFLNCLRSKEFCGSLHSLHHSFDRSSPITVSASADGNRGSEDQKKGYRYAALNLAALHATFGHRKEALTALGEAVAMAQDSNDHAALQQTLAWLHRLRNDSRLQLAECALARSMELSLWSVAASSVQAAVKERALNGDTPCDVFKELSRNDFLCVQHYEPHLLVKGYLLRSVLWSMYGKGLTAALQNQLLLLLNTSDMRMGGLHIQGESVCLALCGLAEWLHSEGELQAATAVLDHAKQCFPGEEGQSGPWIATDAALRFREKLWDGKWDDARRAVEAMMPFRPLEGRLFLARLQTAAGQAPYAMSTIRTLLAELDTSDDDHTVIPLLRAEAILVQAEIHFSVENYPGTLQSLSEATALCKKYHMFRVGALTQMHLAHAQLHLGQAHLALSIIDKCLTSVFAQCGPWERGRAMMLRAKCVVTCNSDDNQEAIEQATELLHEAKTAFLKVGDVQRAKDSLYLQALLYNQIRRVAERNQSAKEFRLLDEQHPTKIPSHSLSLF